MRKIFFTLVMTAMLAPATVLAGAGGGGNAAGNPMDRMAEKLGLSEEQQSEIESIIKEQREKQAALRQETQEQINAVLTDDQLEQLKQLQQQRQEQMRKRLEEMKKQRGEEGGAPPAQ